MITRCVSTFLILTILGSSILTDAQSACMKDCLRKFLKCARLFDTGCCESYVPCMKDICKAKFYPCEQQTSSELKRGSWNKRDEQTDELLYRVLLGRLAQ